MFIFLTGGADHPDNYHHFASARWNQHLSNRFYAYNCGITGYHKTLKAVKVGNLTGVCLELDAKLNMLEHHHSACKLANCSASLRSAIGQAKCMSAELLMTMLTQCLLLVFP